MTRFIEGRRGRFGVELLCRTLGASPSTYYAARSRRPSARAITDARLHEEIARVFEANVPPRDLSPSSPGGSPR
jgi:putative transposase